MLEPSRGVLAICSKGMLGIITVDSPVEICYKDGNRATTWIGLHLTDNHLGKIGEPWSARSPKVIGKFSC